MSFRKKNDESVQNASHGGPDRVADTEEASRRLRTRISWCHYKML